MLVREVKYYLMTNDQLNTEIMKLRFKLDGEQDVKKIKKHLGALYDIAKTLIRKNRSNDEFMRNARWMLYSLKAQVNEVYEETRN